MTGEAFAIFAWVVGVFLPAAGLIALLFLL
jgi:hypothetical protein